MLTGKGKNLGVRVATQPNIERPVIKTRTIYTNSTIKTRNDMSNIKRKMIKQS